MKYADRRAAPLAIIQGTDEQARGIVQIKDLVRGAQIAQNATLDEWKDRPAQVECPRADLVARIRAMLAAQR
jgi:histidyl-tRNA synthetase